MSQAGVTGHSLSLKPEQRKLRSVLGHTRQASSPACSSATLCQPLSTPGPTRGRTLINFCSIWCVFQTFTVANYPKCLDAMYKVGSGKTGGEGKRERKGREIEN